MMPSNHLALLTMLALGYLGLLSTHVSEFATLFALLVEQCVALGILIFFVPLNIWNDDELTRTFRPDSRGSSSSIQVRALRSQPFHQCNWRCHWNFDFDNCPSLCGDRCVHLNCNNRRRPDLYPPPSPPGIPRPIPRPIIHHVPSYQRPGLNPSTSLPFLHLSPQFPPASLPFLNQSDSIDQFPYDLLQSTITRSQRPCRPGGPSTLSTYTNIDRVDGARLSFDELVDGLEGYIEECQANRRHRPRLANWHDCRRVRQDARSNSLQPVSGMGYYLPHICPSSFGRTALERYYVAGSRRRTQGTSSEEEHTLIPSSSECSPVWPPRPPSL
jgi:hypothetical protein